MNSSSLPPSDTLATPPWESGHLIQKLRTARGWSIQQLAHSAGLTDHDIVAIEESQPCKASDIVRRLRGLESAFGVNIISAVAAVDDLNRKPKSPPERTGIVIPFVTEATSIHQNSMEWTANGRLIDVADHVPHLAVIPIGLIRGFLGHKVPEKFMRTVKRKIRSVVTNALPSPHSLFGHYRRLIHAARKDEYARPLRYEANAMHGGAKLVREVTCLKLSANTFETRTHIISRKKHIDSACCARFDNCSECFQQTLTTFLRSAG
jgi:transcriptional regulator with XRE-family HTH domain